MRLPGPGMLRVLSTLAKGHYRLSMPLSEARAIHCQAMQRQELPVNSSLVSAPATIYPTTAEELHQVVAANTPVFLLHPRERHFPCSVEWFLERAELLLVRKGWRRQVLQVLEPFGKLSPAALKAAQDSFATHQQEVQRQERRRKRKQPNSFMMLRLGEAYRAGQADCINDVPVYAHVKEVVDPLGRRDSIEINYMKFLAYNGYYKVFNTFYVGELGAHDADWEHITVRLSPDASRVLGIYYSAHRHYDGVWLSASSIPREPNGRPIVYTALNGHGAYWFPGFVPRLFLAFNDLTSDQGPVWDAKRCVLVTQGKLPQVVSRGTSLDGSSYSSGLERSSMSSVEVVSDPSAADWLAFEGRWGSTVVAPALQDWFARAENPISRTWLQQVFLPLWPGLDSVWEPAQEELEELTERMQLDMEAAMESARSTAKESDKMVEEMVRKARDETHKSWEETLKVVKQYSKRTWWRR
ncbi:hypothetical protein WJX72_004577 [[Myrmecia] bisecta]|uniref:Uncharacterized protein n=1 Tax=[Myrmecia] bisecta TaxID=41462 RepID=A0AAW1PXG7_9CHLO